MSFKFTLYKYCTATIHNIWISPLEWVGLHKATLYFTFKPPCG